MAASGRDYLMQFFKFSDKPDIYYDDRFSVCKIFFYDDMFFGVVGYRADNNGRLYWRINGCQTASAN